MKILILLLSLSIFTACNSDNKAVKDAAKTTINTDQFKDSMASQSGIAQENTMCICTKEFDPVCGSDKKNYPSPCQAKCDGVTKFKKGPCSKK